MCIEKSESNKGTSYWVRISWIYVGKIFDFVASRVDHDATASLVSGNAVAGSTKVQHLHSLVRVDCNFHYCAYLDVRHAITLNSSNTTALIKLDLPDST